MTSIDSLPRVLEPILVIGGAGYIGTQTVDLLLRRGYRVRVLDNLMYGRDSLCDFMAHPRFEFVHGDVTDRQNLCAAAKGTQSVVHLSGLVGDLACAINLSFTRHCNVVATRLAKEISRSVGVKRFIFASSCSVYGLGDTEVSEDSDLKPTSIYARTKVISERDLLNSAMGEFGITILRFATVFGHSRRPRFDLVANLFTAQAFQEGLIRVIGPNQKRPFLHVSDVARAIVFAVAADSSIVHNQVFNVGDQRLTMTIGELAEHVKSIVESFRTVEIEVSAAVEHRSYTVCFDKIRRVLGFEAQVSIDDGIRELIGYFRSGTYGHYRSPTYSNAAAMRQGAIAGVAQIGLKTVNTDGYP